MRVHGRGKEVQDMSDENQVVIPRSFVEIFIPPHAVKPTETRETIAARYDLCEDLAQMLVDQARARMFELGIDTQDVLERMQQGLLVEPSMVTPAEAQWVIRRLDELLAG